MGGYNTKKSTHWLLLNRKEIMPNGCWNWTGGLNSNGYGQISKNEYLTRLAHRVSYMFYVGEISNEFHVCHKCDNPKCFNPFHLFKGTRFDNMADAKAKGRLDKAVHGDLRMYHKGCRCEACTFKNRLSSRKYADKLKIKKFVNNVKSNKKKKYSIYNGVTMQKGENKFLSVLVVDKKRIVIGRYSTDIEAALEYNKAVIKFGLKFTKMNIIRPF